MVGNLSSSHTRSQGLTVLRAFGAHACVRTHSALTTNLSQAVEWGLALRGLQRWLQMRVDTVAVFVTAVVALASVGMAHQVSSSMLGLAVSSAVGGVGLTLAAADLQL